MSDLAALMCFSALLGSVVTGLLVEPLRMWGQERAWWRGYRARDEEMLR